MNEKFDNDDKLSELRKEVNDIQLEIQKINVKRSKWTEKLVEVKGKIQQRKIEVNKNGN